MRPFWGIDITRNKKNDHMDGDPLIVASASATSEKQFVETYVQAASLEKKAQLPFWLQIVQWVCTILATISVLGILRADVSIEQAYQNAPAIFWAGGICAVIAGVLHFVSKKKHNTVVGSVEHVAVESKIDVLADEAIAELGVPEHAVNVDVLACKYKNKDGKIKFYSVSPMQMSVCHNQISAMFVENDTLYIANLSHKYAIPLSEITCIRRVKKRIPFLGWNKDVPFNKAPYKEYKYASNQYGDLFSKTYYILEFRHMGEAWGVYFLPHELSVISSLTGITEIAE